MRNNQKLINTDIEISVPIINDSQDISFGSLCYVEDVINVLLACKVADGPTWKTANKMIDVGVGLDGLPFIKLKAHGIDVNAYVNGLAANAKRARDLARKILVGTSY